MQSNIFTKLTKFPPVDLHHAVAIYFNIPHIECKIFDKNCHFVSNKKYAAFLSYPDNYSNILRDHNGYIGIQDVQKSIGPIGEQGINGVQRNTSSIDFQVGIYSTVLLPKLHEWYSGINYYEYGYSKPIFCYFTNCVFLQPEFLSYFNKINFSSIYKNKQYSKCINYDRVIKNLINIYFS